MEQSLIEPIDAPIIEGIGIVIATPEGWGGATLSLTLGCGLVNPMRAVIEGVECKPKKARFEYRLVAPSTLIILDIDIPRPCYLHIDAVAEMGTTTKRGSMVVGIAEEGPIVIGLPYSIYEPIELS